MKNTKRKLIKYIKIIIINLLFVNLLHVNVIKNTYAMVNNVDLIYFYSTTCGSCIEVNSLLEKVQEEYKYINIIKYDISNLDNKSLLNRYCKEYKVDKEERGTVPIIFIRNEYLYGIDEIEKKLEYEINNNIDINTILIKENYDKNNFENENSIFDSISILKLIMLALLNGLNPCSISMLLFLIMLLGSKTDKIKKIGIGFCIGKTMAFIVLGSICFQFLSKISSKAIINFINIVFIIISLFLFILNLSDYFNIKRDEYGKIKAQLPIKLRKLNHNIIRKFVNKIENGKIILIFSVIIGALIACTEFLCSGQIYLSAIVTVIQTQTRNIVEAMFYLILYSISYMIPLICILILIIKGKKVITVSECLNENLARIKFIYAMVFLIVVIYMIFIVL